MKRLSLFLMILLIPGAALAQHEHHPASGAKPASLIPGLGEVNHPVTTSNAEAQRFFDQGLALVYGFNHEEAVRAFKRAAELDPSLAMAHWGVALALGPNINMPMDAEHHKLAYEAVQKALSLASKASERERAYIEALSKRYSNAPNADVMKLSVAYKDAMKEVMKRYPDDLDAATLYAESLMDLRPWNFWGPDGKPNEGTEEMVAVLESVLKRNPDHIGANHYYIHAVEASLHPEWALPAAQKLKSLAPAAGHLVHMPAHIDMRVGNYEAAARSNAYAAVADEELFKISGKQGMYPAMYYTHNLHFLAIAHSFQGRYDDAIKAAARVDAHLAPYFKDSSAAAQMLGMLDVFTPTSILINVRFHRWDDILKTAAPDRRLPGTTGIWHFGRGLALAAAGKIDGAESELNALVALEKGLSPDAPFGINKASNILKIAEHMLAARIGVAKNDRKAAIELLKKAVEVEDALSYNEPADWYIPAREALGAVLISDGNYVEAERVFRADLVKNPRSGRSLFGLAESLKAQGKTAAAAFVQKEIDAAWKNADVRLRIQDFF
jgi:tetratricopeptide (TPR) repeat protein